MENEPLMYGSDNQMIIKRLAYNISGICAPWVVDIRELDVR